MIVPIIRVLCKMSDVISKLRFKHTMLTVSIVGVILLVVFGAFIGSIVAVVHDDAMNTIDTILEDNPAPKYDTNSSARCFCFCLVGNVAEFFGNQSDIDYYTQNGCDIKVIISAATAAKNGRFKAEGKYFIVKSVTKADGKVYYGVYDRTEDRNILIALSIIGGIIYCAAMIILIVICYILSAKTTAPVKDAMLRQRDLIANASHELKTPLAVISTNLSVVKSEPESTVKDNEKWITAIEGQVGRMDGLVKNMLELSKLEQSELPKADLDFSSIVEGACLELEPVCFEKGITLVTNVEKNITVYGERASLERLVIILLDNAMKYSGEKGKVGCKLTVDNKIRLSVLNTGETITEEDAKHVFDRFYRSDGARKNPDNNSFGLGLSIAQATVQAHGGSISCHGVDNKGSVFEVVLPLAKKKHKTDNAE